MLNSKPLKGLLLIVSLLVFFFGGLHLAGKALASVTYADYLEADNSKIKAEGGQIDLLMLGASRVYRTFVPEILEDRLGLATVVNAGSSMQPMAGSYFILRDYLKAGYKVDNVVLGVTFDGLAYDRNSNVQKKLIIYDRLHGFNKLKFLLEVVAPEDYIYGIYAYRYRDNLEELPDLIKEKRALKASGYAVDTEADEYYCDKGFVYTNTSLKQGNVAYVKAESFDEDSINPEEVKYLDALVDLCKEEGIGLFMVTGPTTMMRIYRTNNYQGAVDFFDSYARDHGLIYHNLNYLVGRETFLPDDKMYDWNHVNGQGAELVSDLYGQILRKDMAGEDTSDYFYTNLAELKKSVKRVIGVKADIKTFTSAKTGNTLADFKVYFAGNKSPRPYYRVLFKAKGDKEFTLLRDWKRKREFRLKLPQASAYTIRIESRLSEKDKNIAFREYDYPKEQNN